MRKGEELKAPRYASAAVTRDYIITRDIIPNMGIKVVKKIQKWPKLVILALYTI